jgi:GT2 family glycosyltransferase
VDSLNGAFMLIRREALEQVGLLDEGYWLYMDDLDWCYRFHRAGWGVWYDGSVSVLHVKGGTTVHERRSGRHRGLRHNVAFHRSMGRFYRKFYSGRSPLFDAAIYLAIGVKLTVAIARSTAARRSLA